MDNSKPPNLAELEAKRDIEGLISALVHEEHDYVKLKAAEALGRLGDPRAVEPLISMLGYYVELVSDRVIEALVFSYRN